MLPSLAAPGKVIVWNVDVHKLDACTVFLGPKRKNEHGVNGFRPKADM